ncbi:hypothetical protein [Halomonas sp. GD1P12]|uniref:hypothetical protein n=1 Tax=Halomonas sp. GD1P12 TaxID=2982691 RepID=UPI0021E37CB8|nr:hypothetical protein [Halomonas sp. GD1P12]UYG00652.1 hypothetical protein OCT39_03595 [Halomonas sp. GD1P12]
MNHNARPLTALEKTHVRTVYLRLVALKWVALLFGGLFWLLGLALPAALVVDPQGLPELAGLFMLLLSLFFLAAGTLFLALGLRQALRQRGATTRLHGTLTEVRINVRGSVYYRYFINDTQIMWPPGAQDLYARSIGRPLSLTVAMIDLAPRQKVHAFLARWAPKTLKRQPSGFAVVLNYSPYINIHGALEKYGCYFLLFYQLKWALGMGLWVALTLLVIMQPFVLTLVARGSIITFLLALVSYFIVTGLVFCAVIKGYHTLRKWLNPDYDDTPHEERLKG